MQAHEVLKQLWIPELDGLHQYLQGLPTNALVGMGAVAAITTYWLAFRPKTIEPRCDPNQQSLELPVGDPDLNLARNLTTYTVSVHVLSYTALS